MAELKDLIGKKIIDITNGLDGLSFKLDDGKEYEIEYSHFPDGSFSKARIR